MYAKFQEALCICKACSWSTVMLLSLKVHSTSEDPEGFSFSEWVRDPISAAALEQTWKWLKISKGSGGSLWHRPDCSTIGGGKLDQSWMLCIFLAPFPLFLPQSYYLFFWRKYEGTCAFPPLGQLVLGEQTRSEKCHEEGELTPSLPVPIEFRSPIHVSSSLALSKHDMYIIRE